MAGRWRGALLVEEAAPVAEGTLATLEVVADPSPSPPAPAPAAAASGGRRRAVGGQAAAALAAHRLAVEAFRAKELLLALGEEERRGALAAGQPDVARRRLEAIPLALPSPSVR